MTGRPVNLAPLARTLDRRPELLEETALDASDRAILDDLKRRT